jgi:hypothetical protein
MSNSSSSRTDIPVLVLSIIAVLVAAVLSMATIVTRSDKNTISATSIPDEVANEAAKAGISAAKWHIECHGRTTAGNLSSHYYINGATYRASWGDMDLQDSMVQVVSEGNFAVGNNQDYKVRLESKIKINFLPAHKNEILTSYYSEIRDDSLSSAQR